MGLAAEGKIVRLVELYKWRPVPWRLDVWPFIGLYVGWLLGVATQLEATDAGIVLAGLAILHILTFLFSAWSVDFRCFVQASKVGEFFFALLDIDLEVSLLRVVPSKYIETGVLECPLVEVNL